MSRLFCKRPSEIIAIKNDYEAYCFDEACALIISKIDNGEKPKFDKKDKKIKQNENARMLPSEIYKKFDAK